MEILTRTLDAMKLEAPRTHGGLTVFPIVRTKDGSRAYLTLDEALDAGTARVTEVSAGGSVPELSFVNDGDRPVLLVDGEELVGAKQNRILNLTILIAAGQKVVIPVSCVEAGRWRSMSAQFSSSKQVMYAKARSRKSMDVSAAMGSTGRRVSNQQLVWQDIDTLAQRYSVHSPTSEMGAVFASTDDKLDDYVRALPTVADQVGAVFAIGERVEGIELFDHPEVLVKLWPKLVRSWALDAIPLAGRETPTPAPEEAAAFVDRVRRSETSAHPGLGLGQDVRFTGAGVVGGALVHDERVVHLCVFRSEEDRRGENGPDGSRGRRMSPASARRRGWGFSRD